MKLSNTLIGFTLAAASAGSAIAQNNATATTQTQKPDRVLQESEEACVAYSKVAYCVSQAIIEREELVRRKTKPDAPQNGNNTVSNDPSEQSINLERLMNTYSIATVCIHAYQTKRCTSTILLINSRQPS